MPMSLLTKIIATVVSSALIIVGVTTVTVYMTRRMKDQSVLTVYPPNATISSITDIDTSTAMSNAIDSTRETIGASVDLDTTKNMASNAPTSIRSSTSRDTTRDTSMGSSGIISTTDQSITRRDTTRDTSMGISGIISTSGRSSTARDTTRDTSMGISGIISTTDQSITRRDTTRDTSMGITSRASHNTGSPSSVMATTNTFGNANISSSTEIARSISTSTSPLTSTNMIFNMTRGASTASVAMTTSDFPACATEFEPFLWYMPEEYTGPFIITTGDFNGDDYVDLVVTNYGGESVGILLGYGDGTFSAETSFFAEEGTFPYAPAVGDFNNDGRMDVVITSYDSDSIVVFLGNGDGTLVAQTPISTGNLSSPTGVVTGYFNRDNILDIAITNSGSNRVGVFIGNGNGAFQTQRTMTTGSNSEPMSIAAADFYRDNHTDLAVVNVGTNRVGVFLGIGNGSFRSQMTFSASGSPMWINVADFNGDTHLDIAVLCVDNNNIGILLGMGNGSFSRQTTYAVGSSVDTYTFTVGDVNRDKRWDIIVPNTAEHNISILLGRGDGTFANQKKVSTGEDSWPSAVAVADFNRDNRSDIAVISSGWGSIDIYLGTC